MAHQRSARVSMGQQTDVLHINIARGSQFNRRNSSLTEYWNKSLKASLPHTLVAVKWLPGFYRFVTKFIRDNPRIASVVGKPIKQARIDGTHPEAIQEFYTLYERIVRKFNIQLCNMWNMDKHGIALGVCANSYVLESSKKKRSYVKSPESREWVLIIEVVSPTGGFIRPLVIFKGTVPQTSHFPTDTPDWRYKSSANGWKTNVKGLSWLTTMYEPETRP
ncbi:hypothetical protein E4T50_04116 [Aureobasidium sp. EXF-12298]|nr:hypothetical protein E4T50_04116 [Aureobasidium sp. EXF-12298]